MTKPTKFARLAKIFALSLIIAHATTAHAKRLALVIGNDNYTAVSKLMKAGNDATAMAKELQRAGFKTQVHRDLNYLGMVKAIDNFASQIEGGDQVVVFYAGHGVQLKTGNYLLPTDIEPETESQVEKTAYGLNALSEKLNEAKAAFTLLIVDACRNNPLKSNGRSIGDTRGLGRVEPLKGQMIVYSASRGQEALDRLNNNDKNPNSVFTREFLTHMKQPGVKIDDFMRGVQESVENLAKSVGREQRPALYSEVSGNFYFYPTANDTSPAPATAAAEISPAISAAQSEDAFWKETKEVGNKDAYEAYLEQYPSGKYAGLAKAAINRMEQEERKRTQREQQEAERVAAQRQEATKKEAELQIEQTPTRHTSLNADKNANARLKNRSVWNDELSRTNGYFKRMSTNNPDDSAPVIVATTFIIECPAWLPTSMLLDSSSPLKNDYITFPDPAVFGNSESMLAKSVTTQRQRNQQTTIPN